MPNLLGLAITATAVALIVLQTPVLPPFPSILLAALLVAVVLVAGFLVALIGGAGLGACLTRKRRCAAYVITAAITALITLGAASRWQSLLLPGACERQALDFRGLVTGLPVLRDDFGEPAFGLVFEALTLSPGACAGPRRLRLFLPRRLLTDVSGADALLQPGDYLAGSVRLRRPWGQVNPLSESGERYYLINGVHAVGSVSALLEHRRSTDFQPFQRVHGLRFAISSWLQASASPGVAPLMMALAIGDRRAMTSEHWSLLRSFGLTHLLVVSGLHVSLLALPGWWLGKGLVYLALFLRIRNRAVRLLPYGCSFSMAAAYSGLAGLSLPTVRALVMLALVFIPGILGRPHDRSRTYGACVLVLLALNPLSVLGASFWLSLTAVGLLLWLSFWERGGGLLLLIKAQMYLVAAMMPLSLYWFGMASTLGAIVNIVAVPLVTWCLLPGLMLAVALSRLDLGISTYLIEFITYIVDGCWRFLVLLSSSELNVGEFTASPPGVYLIMAITAGLLIALPRFAHRSAVIALLLLPLLVSLPEPDEGVVIRFLDVGQGTAILISHHYRHVLYDTGRGTGGGRPRIADALMPFALRKGLSQLDLLVISHDDDDHNGGEPFVTEHLSPNSVLRGGLESEDGWHCRPGMFIPLGSDSWLQSLSFALPDDSDNDGSCVLLLHAYGQRLLLPGDIERQRERDLVAFWRDQLHAGVLLAAHHGSSTSTSRLFLRSVDPRYVVITSGRANRFGHPTQAVVGAIEQQGARVLNTAYDGAITLTIAPDGSIRCRRQRHKRQPFWRGGREPRDCSVMELPSQV